MECCGPDKNGALCDIPLLTTSLMETNCIGIIIIINVSVNLSFFFKLIIFSILNAVRFLKVKLIQLNDLIALLY